MEHNNTHFQNLFSLMSAAATSYNNGDLIPCTCQLRSLSAIALKFADELHPGTPNTRPLRNCPIVKLSGRTPDCRRGSRPST